MSEMRTMKCARCGGPAPIPVTINGLGPYCSQCASGRAPPPSTGARYPTAFSCWGHEEHLAIERVLASGRYTMGPEVAAFEREFADWHGMAHGIMVNSGSSANLVMVSALRHLGLIKEGDKVMVPAIAWSTTYAPLVQHGLDLVLVDVDDTWNADFYGRNTFHDAKLIVACSILGNPANLSGWHTAAGAVGAVLIEDNCESLGAVTPEGRHTGSYGLMSSFSFFYSHQISAIEGGMILTNDDECAALCRMLRAHGWSRDVEPPQTFEAEYDFVVMGYNLRPLELHAAVARAQLKKLPNFIAARVANFNYFRSRVMGLPVVLPDIIGQPSPFGFHFMVQSGETRSRLAAQLRADGIDCRLPTGGSFTRHKYGQPWARQRTENADKIHDCGMFLGLAPFDISDKIDRAVEIMGRVFLASPSDN